MGLQLQKKLLKPIMALSGTREFFMTLLYKFVTVRDSLFLFVQIKLTYLYNTFKEFL